MCRFAAGSREVAGLAAQVKNRSASRLQLELVPHAGGKRQAVGVAVLEEAAAQSLRKHFIFWILTPLNLLKSLILPRSSQ